MDRVEVEPRFGAGRLAERDDADFMGGLRVDDRNRNAGKKPERDESLLAIAEPVVFVGESQACEDRGRVREVKPVLAQVQPPLALRPCELAWHIVYTFRMVGKRIVRLAMRGRRSAGGAEAGRSCPTRNRDDYEADQQP